MYRDEETLDRPLNYCIFDIIIDIATMYLDKTTRRRLCFDIVFFVSRNIDSPSQFLTLLLLSQGHFAALRLRAL